jgi:GDP-4-dehydro-6-deoxy-D-mannose reductase
MKAFVTGASGFVGTYLTAHLSACGDEVIAPDETLDVVDHDAVNAAIARARPHAVYHLAALSHVGESWAEPHRVVRVNVEGAANVLDAARRHDVERVLIVGSAEEYGRVEPGDVPITEDAPLRPVTPYAASKVAAGYLALQSHLGWGLDTIRVRAFSHTGPGQSPRFLIPALAHRIAEAERDARSEIVVGALDPVRDVSDVRDVVRAYRRLVEDGEAGEVYNVCRGEGVAVADIAHALLALARRPLELVSDPALLRPAEVPCLIGEPSRLRAATDWTPEYSLDETLAAVLDDARERVHNS